MADHESHYSHRENTRDVSDLEQKTTRAPDTSSNIRIGINPLDLDQ